MKKLLKVYYDHDYDSELIDYKVIEDSPEMREYIMWDHHFEESFNVNDLKPFIDGTVNEITWTRNLYHYYDEDPNQIYISLLTYEDAIEELDELYRKLFEDFDKENYLKEKSKIEELFNK